MKILMLSSTFPYPPRQGRTQLRTFHFMKYLGQRHQVTLVTQRGEDVTDEQVEALRKWVEELVVFPRLESSQEEGGLLGKAKRLGTFIQQGTPPNVLSIYSPAMQKWVDEALSTGLFEVITSEHSASEIYVRPQWQEQLGTVVNIHSSVYGSYKHALETQTSEKGLQDQLNLPLLRRYEQHYCAKFSAIVTMTQDDRRLLKSLNSESKITVIPNGVDLTMFPKRASNPGGQRLVFIGAMDNPANIDAACFFGLEVFPEIRKRYPEATLELVGARPVPKVLELGEFPGIKVAGQVSSMVEYLHWATICVVPMRKGFGMKNKTLEAMAAGVPVVASDIGLSGLKVDGPDVPLRAMRANSVDEYVYAVGRLFEKPKLREKLSENGRSLVETEYTWERLGERYEQVLLEACPV